MINRECYVCKEYVNDVWVIVISDNKEKVELSGHKNHIDELYNRIQNIKDIHKKSVRQTLKEIGYFNK